MNDQLPRWQQTLNDKKDAQIAMHENAFGKLGELQTPEQKRRLKAALAKTDDEKDKGK